MVLNTSFTMAQLQVWAPKRPKRSLRDRIKKVGQEYLTESKSDCSDGDEQFGKGVVTRKQAQLLLKNNDNKNAPDKDHLHPLDSSSVTSEQNVDSEMPNIANATSPTSPNDFEDNSKSPTAGPSQPDPDELLIKDDAASHLFSDSTLVAENEDLKAYVVKTYFRRMKNFE